MKKVLLLAAAIIGTIGVKAQQQQADFRPVLTATFNAFDTTWNDQDAKVQLSNKLVLIAKKWPAVWATNYYAAYSRIQLSYNDKNDAAKRDAFLDEADTYRDEAVKLLGAENDETYVLAAMIANARLSIDGRARWQKYGKIFDDNLENARKANENNPRIYLLRGIGKYFMPKMFGGGAKAALPFFAKADNLFAKESKDDIMKPYWGQTTNNYFLDQINKGKGE